MIQGVVDTNEQIYALLKKISDIAVFNNALLERKIFDALDQIDYLPPKKSNPLENIADSLRECLFDKETLELIQRNNEQKNDLQSQLTQLLEKLTILDLEHHARDANAEKSLACALSTNQTLVEIKLGFSRMHDFGFKMFLQGIAANKNLKFLSLTNWKISTEQLKLLCQAISGSNLAVLELNQCQLFSDGAHVLAEMIAKNNTLQSIALTNCLLGFSKDTINDPHKIIHKWDNTGVTAMINALEHNRSLIKMDWDIGNNIDPALLFKAYQFLQRNSEPRAAAPAAMVFSSVIAANRKLPAGARAIGSMPAGPRVVDYRSVYGSPR